MPSSTLPDSTAGSSSPDGVRRLLPWLIFAAVAIGVAFLFDDSVIGWVAAHQSKVAKNAAGLISQIGDWPPVCGLGLILLLIAWRKGSQRWTRILGIMLMSAVLSGIVANSVRALCGRARPNAKVPQGWYGPFHDGHWFTHTNQFHSFPSGHSAVILAFCLPLLIFAPRIGRPAMLAVVLVVGSRLYLNVHHLSDVTASLFIGAGCFVLVRNFAARKFGLPEMQSAAVAPSHAADAKAAV